MSDGNRYAAFADTSYSWRFIEQPALDRALPDDVYTAAPKVLDIGSGPGRTIGYHVGRGALASRITGVEPNAQHIAKAQERFPLVRFINQKIQDVTLEPDSFDLVTAQLSLRYLDNTELADTCRNVASALRPGGLFFLLDAHPSNHVVTRSYEGLKNYFEEGVRWVDTPWKEPESYHYRTLGTYMNTVIDAGFNLKYVDECPIADAGRHPDFEADLGHYAISPVRFAVLGMKPE